MSGASPKIERALPAITDSDHELFQGFPRNNIVDSGFDSSSLVKC
jgi:hypothetical protein